MIYSQAQVYISVHRMDREDAAISRTSFGRSIYSSDDLKCTADVPILYVSGALRIALQVRVSL